MGKVRHPNRKAIPAAIRFEVLKRDGFKCRYCGIGAADAKLVIDHNLALIQGGSNDVSNLVAACELCNLGKGASEALIEIGQPAITTRQAQKEIEGLLLGIGHRADFRHLLKASMKCCDLEALLEAARLAYEQYPGFDEVSRRQSLFWRYAHPVSGALVTSPRSLARGL